MCGRYQFSMDQSQELILIAQEIDPRYGAHAWTPGEIRPSVLAPVLVASNGTAQPELQSWGYKLLGPLVINARAESVEEKPLFHESVRSRRCAIPSAGFYEWDREKRKYQFKLPGEDALYMAGLYDVRDGKSCYCILTTAANESVSQIHHRMPLVLRKEHILPWLEQTELASEFLHINPPLLEKFSAEDQLRLW